MKKIMAVLWVICGVVTSEGRAEEPGRFIPSYEEEADYVNEGPWYADSETVVSALARELPEQLQREGYLAASPRK